VDDGMGGVTNFDARGQGISQAIDPANSGLIINRHQIVDNYHYQASLGGPSQSQASQFDTYSVSFDQKLWKSTHLQLAYNHQNYDFQAWQASAPTGMKGDPNQFLRDGVTPNPHAGELYFETYWTQRLREEQLDNLRVTASHEFNLGRWGEYRFAGLAEREERTFLNNAKNEAWINEATTQGAFAAAPEAGGNRVLRRHYVILGDQSTYYASPQHPDPATGAGFMSGVVDPSNPARKLRTRMVTTSGSVFDDPSEQDSYLLAGQAYYFKRKLVIAGGYRVDTLYLHEGPRNIRDVATQEFLIDNDDTKQTHRTLDAKTMTLGGVYHVLPWISVRYNQSDSIELANVGVRLMPRLDAQGYPIGSTSRVGDNPKGEGEDYGIDLNLFDGKIYVRATRFTTNRVGAQGFAYGGTVDNPTVLSDRVLTQLVTNGLITTAEREKRRISSGGYEFDVASTGYEFSVIANPTKGWRLQANYSISDPVSSNIAPEIKAWAASELAFFRTFDPSIPITAVNTTLGAEIARWEQAHSVNQSVDGVGTAGNRREKFSVVTNYSFRNGFLKGLRIGGTVQHQSKQVTAATTSGGVIYGNSFTRADASVAYNFGRVSRFHFLKNLDLQLNVYNVLNQTDPAADTPGQSQRHSSRLQPSRSAAANLLAPLGQPDLLIGAWRFSRENHPGYIEDYGPALSGGAFMPAVVQARVFHECEILPFYNDSRYDGIGYAGSSEDAPSKPPHESTPISSPRSRLGRIVAVLFHPCWTGGIRDDGRQRDRDAFPFHHRPRPRCPRRWLAVQAGGRDPGGERLDGLPSDLERPW
jgi:iron complex outermembrane receptor protein